MSTSESCAIIGGGMLGLTLALRLAESGHTVTLYEAAPSVGGLTASFTQDGSAWDRFYHVIESVDSELLGLLDELGLDENVAWCTTRTNFFDGVRIYPLNDSVDYLRLPALSLIDKLRLGANIVYGASFANSAALEKLTAATWLRALVRT